MVHGMMLVSFSVPDENVFNADTSKEVLGNIHKSDQSLSKQKTTLLCL